MEEEDAEERDDIIFVDDRWKFCQHVGMHLGYFWCLTEFNQLTDEKFSLKDDGLDKLKKLHIDRKICDVLEGNINRGFYFPGKYTVD